MQTEIEWFLEHLSVQKNCSKNTTAAYRNDLNQFRSFLESDRRLDVTKWQDVGPSILQEYLAYLQTQKYASSTIARKVAAVKSFFSHLQEAGKVTIDVVGKLKPPKMKRTLPRPIALEDVALLLAEPGKSETPKGLRDKALLEILYATGMRVSELVNLDVCDIDLERGSVVCGTSSKRRRAILLDEQTASFLQIYLTRGRQVLVTEPSEPALFVNHRGSRLTRQGLWLIIREYVQAVGIKEQVTPHTLRHSIATHLLNAGAKLKEVQKRLGHASASTTQIYRKISDETANKVLVDDAIFIDRKENLPLPAGTD